MSAYTFWIIIRSIICVTSVMLATIISSDFRNNSESENNEEISDEELKRAANIFATAICKKIFEEDKNGRSEERNTEG